MKAIPKATAVEVIQWTGENASEVLAFLASRNAMIGWITEGEMGIELPHSTTVINVGQWLVANESLPLIYTNERFHELYEVK